MIARARESLQVRLLVAFLFVAAVAIAAFAGLTLWSARGDVNALVHRQQQATVTNATNALADAYRQAGTWGAADLGPARAVAFSGDALLEVRDRGGHLVLQAGRGLGPAPPPGQWSSGHLNATFGDARVVPVFVAGERVGTARIRFPVNTLPPAEQQLRSALMRTTAIGVAIAAAAALLVSLLVTRTITRPLRRLTSAVRRLGSGDRSVRANLNAPGELGELGEAIDAMATGLERNEELRKALTADVAHELRTPVTILAAHCEAILDGVTRPTPEYVTSLYEEVQRLSRLIEDLEALASAEAAGLQLERVPVELDDVVRAAAGLLEPQFAAAGVELDVDGEEGLLVAADERRLVQVVRNLLTNALAFTPPGGHVGVDVAGDGDGLARLTVWDTGAGIPPDELPHVFERFWRGSRARNRSGSGIGLAVVDELVRAHGGTVTAESKPGHGTRFIVRLPSLSASSGSPRLLRAGTR